MTLRRPVPLALALALLAGTALAAPPASEPLKERDNVWAQSYVPRAADPQVRFGQLANGMRYAVMRNNTPKGVTSLRLRIGAGSLDETDDQQGLAHFLEHMAFKGSEHAPGDEMIKRLERLGLAFGADTNASTSWNETIYKFDLPNSGASDLETALTLMRDQASGLTLSQAAMDPERGVVLSEERLRDTPGYQAQKTNLNFLLEGQRVTTRWPIGDVKVLNTAPVSRIRDFYTAHYRPELATLVVVGDVDPVALEQQIRQRFGDWKGQGAAPPAPDRGMVKTRTEQVKLFTREGAPPMVQINWVSPYDDGADTFGHERAVLVRQLGLAVLNRRLALIGASADAPFVSAGGGRSSALNSAEVTTLHVNPKGDDWKRGLSAVVTEERRLAEYGVSQEELDREITEARGSLVNGASGAATRRSPQIADAIVQAAGDDTVYTSPAQDVEEFERAVKGLTAAEVSAAAKAAFAGSGPLVFISSPKPVEGGEAAVRAALTQALAAQVSAPVAQAKLAWPYAHLGAQARVTARSEVKDLGVTFATLSNGVKVTVKPTAFRKDQVLITARFGHGREGLPLDRATPTWATPSSLVQGGTRELTFEDMDRIGAGRIASTAIALGDDAWTLTGATRPADLAFELQTMTAYLTRPGWRPESFERTKAAALTVVDQIDSTPSGVLGRDFGLLSHSGDPRWTSLPNRADLARVGLDQVKATVPLPLDGAPLEVTIVGDVTVEKALALAASTFGTLPPRHGPSKPAAAALEARFHPPGRTELVHKGRADQAVAFVAWPTLDLFSDPQEVRALGMAAEVLQLRLIDEVRVAEGATYSPAASSTNSEVFPGYGYVYAQVETPPAKIGRFFDNVDRIAADLAAKGPTPDELERARRPRVEQRIKTQQTNEYWIGALSRAQSDPRQLQLIRDLVPGSQKVTAADVQAAIARYVKPATAWRIVVEAPNPTPGSPKQAPIAPPGPPRPPKVEPAAPVAAPVATPDTKTGSLAASPPPPTPRH